MRLSKLAEILAQLSDEEFSQDAYVYVDIDGREVPLDNVWTSEQQRFHDGEQKIERQGKVVFSSGKGEAG